MQFSSTTNTAIIVNIVILSKTLFKYDFYGFNLYILSVLKNIYTNIHSYIVTSIKVFDLITYYLKSLINKNILLNDSIKFFYYLIFFLNLKTNISTIFFFFW